MAELKHSAFMPTAALLRQVSLSVAATVIATGVMAGLRAEWAAFRYPSDPGPAMTSGGKFAARAEPLADKDSETSILLPASLPPLLASEAKRAAEPVQAPAAVPVAGTRPVSDTARLPKRVAHAVESRHRVAEAATLPPRRADYIAAEPVSLEAVPVASDGGTMLSTARGLARHALDLGEAVWDRVTPAQLFP